MRAPLALERVHRMDPFLLAARSTLVALLVVVHTDRPVLVFAAVATAVLFLQEHLLRSPWPWFVIAAVLGRDQLGEWWLVDDHVVLMTYWLLAVGLSRFATEPDAVLRQSARWVIVGVFAFAFGWKLLSSQYLSGDFFEHTLLRDPRFEPWATWVGAPTRPSWRRGGRRSRRSPRPGTSVTPSRSMLVRARCSWPTC